MWLILSAMEDYLQIPKALSEPDSLFLPSRSTADGRLRQRCSGASSASLLSLDSHPPLPNCQLTQRSRSVGQSITKAKVPCFAAFQRRASTSPAFSSDNHPSDSSSADDDDECTNTNGASASLQYERFGEISPREDTLLNNASIPRRREFSEQFRDLAQLHQQADVPRAKWDDASRLFPKQFGLPSSVALNIWKHVDSDADMMLTESEYCLAAHLASKYATPGFALISSQCSMQEKQSLLPLLRQERTSPSINATSPCQRLLRRRKPKLNHRGQQDQHQRNCDLGYLDNDEDESHDLLISPQSRPLDREDDEFSYASSGTPKTLEEPTEDDDEEEEDDHKGVSDDEIGVRALLPSSARLMRPPVDATALLCDENGADDSDSSFASSYSSTSSSSQESCSSASRSSSSSSSPVLTTRVENVSSASPSAKSLEPVEVLSKFTRRSVKDILSLSPSRRRRLLASLVRAAKSTNYTLLRLNNELAGELQELCDQHTSLNAQVRHLSGMRT